MGEAGAVGLGVGLFEIALELDKAVQLLKPQRGGGRRIFGGGAESVPAPEIPLDAHQPLAGAQFGLTLGALGAIDKAHLPHAADKHLGDGDIVGQRIDPGGERLGIGIGGQNRPARAPRGIDLRCAQIVGQGSAERLFIAALHPQKIEHLPAFLGVTLNELRQRGNLGPKRIGLALGGGARSAGIDLARLDIGSGSLGLGQRGFGGVRRGAGFGFGLASGGEIGFGAGQRGFGLFHRLARPLGIGLGLGERLTAVVEQALRRMVPRGKAGGVFGHLREVALAVLQERRGLTRRRLRRLELGVMALPRLGNLACFPFEALDGLACILVKPRLALDIAGKLFDPRPEGDDHLAGAGFLIGQRVALDL